MSEGNGGAAKSGGTPAGASVDRGYEAFRRDVVQRIPDANERMAVEAWMRGQAADLRGGGATEADWSTQPGHVRIGAQYGRAAVTGLIPVPDLALIADEWGKFLARRRTPDAPEPSALTQAYVGQGLILNHHTETSGGHLMLCALVWLAVRGPEADRVIPLLDTPELTIRFDIGDSPAGEIAFWMRVF